MNTAALRGLRMVHEGMQKAREEKAQLDEMTDRELVAYYNILTMSAKCLMPNPADRTKNERHLRIVDGILKGRGLGPKKDVGDDWERDVEVTEIQKEV